MKLDYDLLRELLLTIERVTDGRREYTDKYFIEHTASDKRELVFYHLKFLADVSYIEYRPSRHKHLVGYITDITPTGRAYLDSIRSNDLWSSVKKHFGSAIGDIAFDNVKSVASALVKSACIDGLGVNH